MMNQCWRPRKRQKQNNKDTATIDIDTVIEIAVNDFQGFFINKIEIRIHPVLTGRQGKDIGDVKFNSDGDGMGRYRCRSRSRCICFRFCIRSCIFACIGPAEFGQGWSELVQLLGPRVDKFIVKSMILPTNCSTIETVSIWWIIKVRSTNTTSVATGQNTKQSDWKNEYMINHCEGNLCTSRLQKAASTTVWK